MLRSTALWPCAAGDLYGCTLRGYTIHSCHLHLCRPPATLPWQEAPVTMRGWPPVPTVYCLMELLQSGSPRNVPLPNTAVTCRQVRLTTLRGSRACSVLPLTPLLLHTQTQRCLPPLRRPRLQQRRALLVSGPSPSPPTPTASTPFPVASLPEVSTLSSTVTTPAAPAATTSSVSMPLAAASLPAASVLSLSVTTPDDDHSVHDARDAISHWCNHHTIILQIMEEQAKKLAIKSWLETQGGDDWHLHLPACDV